MRKVFLSLVLLATLILAACGGDAQPTATLQPTAAATQAVLPETTAESTAEVEPNATEETTG